MNAARSLCVRSRRDTTPDRATRDRATSLPERPGRIIHPAATLALILVASFMVVLDFSIVNVALAAIGRELHTGASAVQWAITAYAITFGGLLILGGNMADLFGRRRGSSSGWPCSRWRRRPSSSPTAAPRLPMRLSR